MAARPVELRVGGQSYRVVSSASAEDLERLATVVDEKLTSLVPPGKPLSPQSLLLVAIALAHDVEVHLFSNYVLPGGELWRKVGRDSVEMHEGSKVIG